MSDGLGNDSPGSRLVRTAFLAVAPVPIEEILGCAPLAMTLDPYLPPDEDADSKLVSVETILQDFLMDRKDTERTSPRKRRVSKQEEFSDIEYAIALGRLMFYGPVGKEEGDYRWRYKRQEAAVQFPGQVEVSPRRVNRPPANTWNAYKRELVAYLALRNGDCFRSPLVQDRVSIQGFPKRASQDVAERNRSIPIEDDEGLESDLSTVLVSAPPGSIGSTIRGWWSKRLGKVALIGAPLASVLAVSIVVGAFIASPGDLGVGVQGTPPGEASLSAPWRAGWGPEREMFTVESGGAPYPAFNSISDNPNLGDERNFVGLRNAANDTSRWRDDVWAKPGETYNMRVYVNNAGLDVNGTVSAGIIQEARVSVGIRHNEGESSVYAMLSGKNVTTVYDGATLHVDPNVGVAFDTEDILLEGYAFADGGFALDSGIFAPDGTLLGYEQMDGFVKPGYEYAFYIVLKVKIS